MALKQVFERFPVKRCLTFQSPHKILESWDVSDPIVFHSGRHEGVDWNTIRPLDEDLIERMRDCEAGFMHIMNRREEGGRVMSYHERKRTYLQFLRYWNHMFEEHEINLFLIANLPHRRRTYLLYCLCKAKGIQVLFFRRPTIKKGEDLLFLSEDWNDPSSELCEEYKRLMDQFGESKEEVKLLKWMDDYYLDQVGEKKPDSYSLWGPAETRRGEWRKMVKAMI